MDARWADDRAAKRGARGTFPTGASSGALSEAVSPLALITLARRLLRISQQQLGEQLVGTELPPTHAGFLWAIRQRPEASQQELAREFGISPAQASGLVEDLERGAWIIGGRSPADRRRHAWQLTPRARAFLAALDGRLAERWHEALAGLPELEALCAALARSGERGSSREGCVRGGADETQDIPPNTRRSRREVA